MDLDSFELSFSPNGSFWVHFGPICLLILWETHFAFFVFAHFEQSAGDGGEAAVALQIAPQWSQIAPQWSQASLGSGTIWDPGSMEAEGRMPTSMEAEGRLQGGCVGGEGPSWTPRGMWAGGSHPQKGANYNSEIRKPEV